MAVCVYWKWNSLSLCVCLSLCLSYCNSQHAITLQVTIGRVCSELNYISCSETQEHSCGLRHLQVPYRRRSLSALTCRSPFSSFRAVKVRSWKANNILNQLILISQFRSFQHIGTKPSILQCFLLQETRQPMSACSSLYFKILKCICGLLCLQKKYCTFIHYIV